MKHFVLFLLLTAAAFAADYETGFVKHSDGAAFHWNTIPQIARLSNGQLLTVWWVMPKDRTKGSIYGATSSDSGRTWSEPKVLIEDAVKTSGDPNILVDGKKVFVFSTQVLMPNKINKSWIGMVRSDDDGKTWTKPAEIPIPRQYVAGKQHNGIKLRDGTYMFGVAWDKWPEMGMAARTEGEMDLTTGVMISKDGEHWTLHGAVHTFVDKISPNSTNGLCEPSLVELDNGEILMILRSGDSFHYESRSSDGGVSWSIPVRSSLPGNNTPSALWRLDQNSKEIIVVWNASPLARYPLSTAISADGGKTWSTPRIVAQTEALQVSYPGITQASDGTFVAVWQQALKGNNGRDIRWARFTRDWVLGK